MRCSLVLLQNGTSRTFKEEEYTRIAELAGVPFIDVTHRDGFGKDQKAIRGFQGVSISVSEYQGRYVYSVKYSEDREGNPQYMFMPLVITPNEETNELSAKIPDTAFNRGILGRMLTKKSPMLRLKDKKLETQLAEEGKKQVKASNVEKDKDGVVVSLQKQMSEKETEIARLKRQLNNKEKAEKIVGKAITESQKKRKKAIRAEIKEKFYAENPKLIQMLKDANGKGWALSAEYKEKVQTPIDNLVYNQCVTEGIVENDDSEGTNS